MIVDIIYNFNLNKQKLDKNKIKTKIGFQVKLYKINEWETYLRFVKENIISSLLL